MATNRGYVAANGVVLQGEELAAYCQRKGKCPRCGRTQVKEPKGFFGLSRSWKAITKENTTGGFDVYKGFCLQPTCYTLDEAKEELGEAQPRRTTNPRRRRRRAATATDEDGPDDSMGSEVLLDAEVEYVTPGSEWHASTPSSPGNSLTLSAGGTVPESHPFNETSSCNSSNSNNYASASLTNTAGLGALREMDDSKIKSLSLAPGIYNNSLNSVASSNGQCGSVLSATGSNSSSSLSGTRSLRKALPRCYVPPAPPQVSNSTNAEKQTPEMRMIARLEESANDQDYHSLLNTLDSNVTKPEVVIKALELLRGMVLIANDHNPHGYVFPSDTWVKIVKAAMSANASNEEIQEEAIFTMWLLCALSPQYIADVTRYYGVPDILNAMEKFNKVDSIRMICCGTLECLTRYETCDIQLGSEVEKRSIRNLVLVLEDPASSGKDWAIRALYNMSCQAATSSQCRLLGILIRDSISDGLRVETIFSAIWKELQNEVDMEYTLWLLWRISAPPTDDDAIISGESVIAASEDLLAAIAVAMDVFQSQVMLHASFGLLSNLALPYVDSDVDGTIVTWTTTVVNAVLDALQKHEMQATVQVAGLHTLCNILSDPLKRLALPSSDRAIQVVIKILNRFASNPDIQCLGCRALAYLASRGEHSKTEILSRGGVGSIVNTFRIHEVKVDMTWNELQATDNVRNEACAALAQLASLSGGALQILNSGLLAHLATQTIKMRAAIRPSCFNTILESVISSLTTASGPEVDRAYETLVDTILNVIHTEPAVAYAEAMINSLHTITCNFPRAIDFFMKAIDGNGFYRLLHLLRVNSDSAPIQHSACGILANIYAKEPFRGRLVQIYRVDIGSTAVYVQIRTAEEVNLVRHALRTHRSHPLVTETACAALCNFCVRDSVSANDFDSQHLVTDDVISLFSGFVKDTVDMLAIHKLNLNVQRNALHFLYALTFILDEVEIRRWSPHIIDIVTEAMSQFPDDVDVHQCCCNILVHFFDLHDNESIIDEIGGSRCLGTLARNLHLRNEDLVTDSLHIIAVLLGIVFTAAGEFLEDIRYIDHIMDCMFRYPESATIQAASCSILTSLATLNDDFAKETIAQSGGARAVVEVLQQYRQDPFVQQYAYKALAGIAAGIPQTTMLPTRLKIVNEISFTLRNHREDETVQCALLEACWELCRKDEYFMAQMSSSDGIAQIIDTMAQHLSSADLQKAGCSLLWALATYGDNKRIIGEAGGIQAVILAILAHINSTALQKEAMAMLKNISTISSNKTHLREQRGEDAIMLAMQANADSPTVLCSAMSALNNIAVDSETRRVSAVPDALLQCILTIMRLHPICQPLQMNACFLLKSYSFCDETLTLMAIRRDELIELLTMASESFPDDCGDRAYYVLQRI